MKRQAATFLLAAGLGAAAAACLAQESVKLWDEAYLRVRAGVTVRAVIHISIDEGHYVVAANARDAKLTALALKMERVEDIRLGAPEYPKPQSLRLGTSTRDLPAYEGLLEIGLPLTVSSRATWEAKSLRGTLIYQQCDRQKCLAPATLPIELNIEIRPSGVDQKS